MTSTSTWHKSKWHLWLLHSGQWYQATIPMTEWFVAKEWWGKHNLFFKCPLPPGFPNTSWKPNLFLPSYVTKDSYSVGSVQKGHRFSPQNVFKKNQYNVHYPQFTVTMHHAKHLVLPEVTTLFVMVRWPNSFSPKCRSIPCHLYFIWTSAMQKPTSQSDDYWWFELLNHYQQTAKLWTG